MEESRTVRRLAQHLLDELARDGASHRFWDSYWHLAPWLSSAELAHIHAAAARHCHANTSTGARRSLQRVTLIAAAHQPPRPVRFIGSLR